MALKVGELIALLNIDESGYIQGLKGSVEAAKNAEKTISQKFDQIGKAFVKVGKSMTKFVTLPLLGIGIAALKGAADFEKQRVAFETLLGSAKKAGTLLRQLEKFAAMTPFQLPGLIEGSKRLLAFGVAAEDIVDTMTNLGNAAMGNQEVLDRLTLAYGKVRAKGRASMEELNMFTEAGVPIMKSLAKHYGITTEELFKYVSTGKVGFEDVNQALTDLTTGQGQFAGMIEKQSETLSGLFSTLRDNIGLLLKDMGEVLLPTLKDIIAKITEWVQAFRDLSDRTKKIIIAIAGFAAAAGPVLLIIGKLILAVKAIIPIMALLKIKFIALNAAMLANPIVLIIAGIAALGVGIVLLVKYIKTATGSQDDLSDSTEEYKEEVVETKKSLRELREEYNRLSLAQKIAKAETDLVTLGLKLQKAEAEKNIIVIAVTATKIEILEETLKDLESQLVEKTKEALVDLAETLETKVSKELLYAERAGRIFGKTAEEVAKDKISILKSAITEMIEEGVEPGTRALQDMIDLMRELGRVTVETETIAEAIARNAIARIENRVEKEREQGRISLQHKLDIIFAKKEAQKKADADELAAAKKLAQDIKAVKQSLWDYSVNGLRYVAQIGDNLLQAQLDNEKLTDDERKALQIKAAKRSKGFSLFEAAITGAQAIISGFASKPFLPVGLLMGAFATTLVGLQMAAILSRPIPKAIRGGLVKMIEGGVFQGQPGIDTNAVAVTSGEYIMPPAQTARFANELEQMRKGEFSSEVNIEATPVTIILDGREIGKGVIDFLAAESDKGGVRINPKAIKANT